MATHMRRHHPEKSVDNSRSTGTGGAKRKQDSDPAGVAKQPKLEAFVTKPYAFSNTK